jgi:acetyl-CoA carboxylase biotin carboxyl carrier protein
VADEPSETPGPFDVRTIRYLAAVMSRHDLSEIDLREGDLRIRLLRGPRRAAAAPAAPTAPAERAPHTVPTTPAAATAPEKPAKALLDVKSPMVGTFYARANPDAEPFVRVGSRVTPTTVVGLIEAMKLFNEVAAECAGVVAEVLVENQQPVEYGQVLFRVDPAG